MTLSEGSSTTRSDAEDALAAMADAYDRAYEVAARGVSLSAAQACILVRLGEPHSMSALATQLGCDASNVTQIVSRLEALDLVSRTRSADDGRVRLVTRTPRGNSVSTSFEEAFVFARTAADNLTLSQQGQLTALLLKALE